MIIVITGLVSGNKTCYRIGNYNVIELVIVILSNW
jgi:hypothetical protein